MGESFYGSDDQILGDLKARHRSATKTWKRYIFWTLWFFVNGVVQLYWGITADNHSERITGMVFCLLFGVLTWSGAKDWDKAQITADASRVAMKDWELIAAQGAPPKLREHIADHTAELIASILAEQKLHEEYVQAKAERKAAKKTKKGVRR